MYDDILNNMTDQTQKMNAGNNLRTGDYILVNCLIRCHVDDILYMYQCEQQVALHDSDM
jgi:hypothetical protein